MEATSTPTVPEALRALADVLERHPNLPAPDLTVYGDTAGVQGWTAVAITDDLSSRRSRTEHAEELWLSGLRLRVVKVSDSAMRRHYAQLEVQRRHADEVDALLAQPVPA